MSNPKSTLSLSALVLMTLIGCNTAIRSPEYPKPAWTVENPDAAKQAQRGSQRASRNAMRESGSSSLDALREGRNPATPQTSPVRDIYFGFDRHDLSAEAREILNANAEWMKKNPPARVEIEGHCDERGTNEYNLALGAKRAESARNYLATLGIAASRLSTISYGEEIPVCTEATEECWQKNRRVRFVIVPARPAS